MSSDSSKKIDMKEAKKYLEKEMIKGILEYARNGTFPNNNSNSFINAYTLVLNMADKGDDPSEELFNYYNKIIQDFIEECQKKISKISKTQIIDTFIKQTENINFVIYWMYKIFIYLDKFYTNSKQKDSLSKSAMGFYKHYFANIQNDIYREVNKLIKEDRNCNYESRPKIKIILKIIDDLDLTFPKIIRENNKFVWIQDPNHPDTNNEHVFSNKWYKETFEKETTKFVKDKANADIHSMSAPEYISSQLKYLDEEKKREEEYINSIFHNSINSINYTHLVGEIAEELGKMDTGIPYMFLNKRNEELKKAYQLISLYPKSLSVITTAFQPYIKKRGEEINNNKEISKDPKKFIPELIKLKKEMDKLVEDCFDNDSIFQDTKNKSFSNFMNKDFYAKQLANYTDYCMKIGFKGKEEEVEKTLNEIIGLFKCLNTKLVFQIESNKKMSDRLIKNTSISTNYEKKLISKLKQEQGVNYVSKMTQMMNDLDKNKKEIDDYKSLEHHGMPNGIKFNVQVVSQSAWEINKKDMEQITLPKYFISCKGDFEKFYLRKHSGQKLMWCFGLSKVEIQYICFKNKNISISTLPQYLLLLQLEKYPSTPLTISKLAELLGCHISTILTDITGLVFNPSFNPQSIKEKGLILGTFDIKTKNFKESDEISFNYNFNYSRQKFQTLPLTAKKSAAETRETEMEEAQITKKYQDNILQATLTRIMKSRIGQKTTHVWLVNEAAKQIDLFRAQPQQIKENIEKLIEKNIMKRADNDRTCYDYIA
jgi:hypothetical protein